MRKMLLQRLCQSMQMRNYMMMMMMMIMLPSLRVGGNLVFRLPYSTEDKVITDMADKARSTAEEFIRQAKEKKDEIREEATKETLDNSKEAVLSENSTEDKQRLKDKVEEGDYDRIDRT